MRQIKNFKVRSKDMKGKLIVVDGGEGSGTTSVVDFLAKELGERVIRTREPGGSPLAEKIRGFIFSECKEADAATNFALFWAARRDHFVNVIKPALENGKHVITDRFDSSTWAYQIFAQEGDQLRDLFWAMRRIFLNNIEPSCYILLDLDPKIGIARAKGRGGDLTHFDLRNLGFHQQVRNGLKDFIHREPIRTSSYVVDAELPLYTVQAKVLGIVEHVISEH